MRPPSACAGGAGGVGPPARCARTCATSAPRASRVRSRCGREPRASPPPPAATRTRPAGLVEPYVVEPDIVQRLQAPPDLGDVLEELERLLDGHLQDIGDRPALEADVERLAVVALAVALLARDVHVRQEVHLDLDLTVAAAHLAAPALHVEREAPGLVSTRPRLLGARKQVADVVEDAGV